MGSFQIFQRLAVVNGVDAYSQPFPMQNANAFRIGTLVYSNSATSLSLTPEGSVDGQNWHDLTAATGLTVGYSTFTQSSITDAMVRLRASVVGTGVIILASEAWTSQQ